MADLFFITCKVTVFAGDNFKKWRGARCFIAHEIGVYKPFARCETTHEIQPRRRGCASWWLNLDAAITHYEGFAEQCATNGATSKIERVEIWKFRSRAGVDCAEAAPEVVWPVPACVEEEPLTFKPNGWTRGFAFTLAETVDHKRRDGTYQYTPNRELIPSDFADFGDRKLLADLGYFSCDLPKHRAKRDAEAQRVRYLEEAYEVLHLDRGQQHALIAARLEAGRTDGVWARSTKEYSEACTRLDNFVLLASPAIAQSIAELEA